MNKLTIYPIAILFLLVWSGTSQAQFNVKINVLSGSSTTTCTDPVGSPDPQWAVNINSAGWVTYPSNGICFTNFPNTQFNQNYACLADIPATIPVCFRAFENDANILNPCSPVYSCQAELCINVPVPPMGTVPFNITLPTGGASEGSVSMNIVASGVPGGVNDALCNAIPLGILQTSIPVGFPDTSIFNNFCATNLNEPDPGPLGGGWFNNQGVWFTFTTSANPSDVILIETNSDPSNFNDPVNLQVAIFESSDNTCAGSFSLVTENYDQSSFDETVVFTCPKPNTTYYVLVDGVFSGTNNLEVQGWFGLQATQLDVLAASELRCTAENIGTVPLGGSISSPLRTNACSNNTNATVASAFGVQKTVWFTFTPPPTGHVFLQGTSSAIDPIALQLAVYYSNVNGCTGMVEVESQYTATENDELVELHCLDPSTTYFVMVDGASADLQTGIFTLTLTDAGNETPTTSLNPVVCFGDSFAAGGNNYNQTGIYFDTLQLAGGCDSIVITNLTVLPELQPNLQIVQQGAGAGNTIGQAQASATGGAGNYTYLWSNGQTTNLATGLVGGNNYCVTITDGNNCQTDTCFLMPFYVNFVPSATGSSLDCNGDSDGTIEFSALGGQPPYQYDWQDATNSYSGTGLIPIDGQVISLPGLPAGVYSIYISDPNFDTTVVVTITEPAQLQASFSNVTNVSCFMECDGLLTLDITGGTEPYQADWSNGASSSTVENLCAGAYSVTITDVNGCSLETQQVVSQPFEFIATATQVQDVSCFEGTEGKANVTANENPASILWSNGETTSNINDLAGGEYFVTVTNASGCVATASVVVDAPSEPVGVLIYELNGIACQGDNSGELQAVASGPGSSFTFNWSNGGSSPTNIDLLAGTYTVTLANENGCTATANATLTEPTEMQAIFSTNELTCLDPFNAGIITVDNMTGGNPPYIYSADGISFSTSNVLAGYPAGAATFYVQDDGGCLRTFQANIPGPTELLIDLGNDKEIQLGDSIKLQVTTNQTGLTYAWSPAEGLGCVDCAAPFAAPVKTTTYSVIVTTPEGCTAMGDVIVNVKNRLHVYFPNVFSPNGDGINDEFMPFTGPAVQTIKTFRVFDRQGNEVFAAQNMPQNQVGAGWNGDFRDKHMQPAVFVWVAEIEFLDGRVRVYKGDVTLVR
ncbi:MAG: gliding motility-associated C-terminal domain-containing protein [Saprospiraceae bacterium]|nr:gliding motility-associated C-terminal domain-containing protein [Saprospiraceae bacterium]